MHNRSIPLRHKLALSLVMMAVGASCRYTGDVNNIPAFKHEITVDALRFFLGAGGQISWRRQIDNHLMFALQLEHLRSEEFDDADNYDATRNLDVYTDFDIALQYYLRPYRVQSSLFFSVEFGYWHTIMSGRAWPVDVTREGVALQLGTGYRLLKKENAFWSFEVAFAIYGQEAVRLPNDEKHRDNHNRFAIMYGIQF